MPDGIIPIRSNIACLEHDEKIVEIMVMELIVEITKSKTVRKRKAWQRPVSLIISYILEENI
jgi:hypothetical protein